MAQHQILLGGFKMPSVGLGTWNSTNEEELETALDAALESGYRHIDTAYIYRNEATIGRVLQKWFTSGKLKREDLFVTTKLPCPGVHPDRVEDFITKSLEALQLEFVDLYLIHFPIYKEVVDGKEVPAPTDHLAVWEKMEEQVDLGRAKTIGLSNFNSSQIQRIWENARIKPACLQVELSPYFQQKDLVDYCQEKGIVVVGYSSLGSPGYRKNLLSYTAILENDTIKEIATKYNKTPAQIVLRFLLQKNIVVIPKSVTPSRVKQNIDIFDFDLASGDFKTIEKLEKGEEGRTATFIRTEPTLYHHPEFPFKKIQAP